MKVLEKSNGKCSCCGRSQKHHGVVIHVDHIKPRSTHPELELVESNLQVLCEDCNMGKMADYKTDWRQHRSMATPWPIHDVLAKLADASDILLHHYNYDGHGYEQIEECVRRARDYTELIKSDLRK